MIGRSLIVSAADEAFFPFLRDLLLSMAATRSGEAPALGILDLGLIAPQRRWLGRFTDKIVEPDWDLTVPDKAKSVPAFRGLTARPFLPKYFPGFDLYLWLDADIWLQDWSGLALYLAGAMEGQAAATPQVDRAYLHGASLLRWRVDGMTKAFGRKAATILMQYPHINLGAFAIRREAPHWAAFAQSYQEAIERSGEVFRADQVAFNHAVYLRRLPIQLLPARCNWLCHLRAPIWDEAAGVFCEPYLPYPRISMLHLSADSKDGTMEIRTRSGGTKTMTLRYPGAAEDDAPTD